MNQSNSKKYIILSAGILLALAFGILYTWSILKGEIDSSIKLNLPDGFHWDISSLNDPYSLSLLVFSFTMIFSGRIQDNLGPRITTYIGSGFVFVGFMIIAFSKSYLIWLLGYGVFIGVGIGFGYAAITPVVIKWFPSQKTGLVTGLVVAGFGLSSVYIAPLYNYLINSFGLTNTIFYYGIGFFIVVMIAASFIKNPGTDYTVNKEITKSDKDKGAINILKTSPFYILWTIYFIGAGSGLMVIGFITEMVKKDLGTKAFLGVAIIAIGNALGRIVSGYFSDKIGRVKTLLLFYLFQTLLMFVAFFTYGINSVALIVFLATFIGFNYGSNLSVFPAITNDLWGMKNFGANYGILYTSWGLGGFALSRVSQMIKATTGSLEYSFLLAGILLGVGSLLLIFFERLMKQRTQ